MAHFNARVALIVLTVLSTFPAVAQSAANTSWSGQVQCQLDDQDQNFSRHELQTWMITGATPTVQGAMNVYPASWSATGQGALQRMQGAQTTNLQWTTNVPPTQATIVIFVRASDNRLIIKPWHSQMRMDNAVNGMRQQVINGVAQQSSNFSHTAWEWQFPRIEDSSTSTSVSGSSATQADAGDAELLHNYGGLPPNAVCRWQFARGGAGSSNPSQSGSSGSQSNQNPQGTMAGNTNYPGNGQNCETPSTVQQTFENMKADMKSQYDRLIQGTSDPNEIGSLTSQEQRMLASLSSQEQHDMAAASQGCLQASNQNTTGAGPSVGNNQYPGGSQNSGNNQYPGSGQSGNSQYPGNVQNTGTNNTGSNSNPGSNPYSGNNQNSGNNQSPNNTQSSSNSNSNSNPSNNSVGSSTPNGSSVSSGQPAPTPQLLSLTPSSVSQGNTSQVTLVGRGTHWQSQATNVSFGPQVTVQSFTADPSGTSAVATINVASNASLGSRPVMLMSGAEMVGLASGLTVTAASSQGGSGTNSSPMRMNTGSGFAGSSVVLAGMLSGVSPTTNNGQQNLTVTVTGERTNFANGSTTVSFVRASQPGSTIALPANALVAGLNHSTSSAPPPVQVGPVSVSSATSATVPLTINPTAAAGTYSITVSTPTSKGTETVTLNNAFTVTTTPSISGVQLNPGAGIVKNTGTTNTSAAPTSATYRVTMTGLMCLRAITGGGDAVYGAAVIRQYDRRSGQSTMSTNANTWVYGDTNGMIGQRKQAGSRGPMGGVGAGDFVPTGFIVGPKDTLPPQANVFPMAVWQGTLTDGIDALVISPSLWISYGDNSMFFNWNQNEDSLTNSIFLDAKVQNEISTQTFATLFIGASQNVSNSSASSLAGAEAVIAVETSIQAAGLTFGIPVGVFAITGPSHDRPIGVAAAKSGDPTSTTVLPNATLVLTREMIEKRLGSSAWTTMSFDFRDDPSSFSILPNTDRPGEYQMFIQIERQ